MPEQKCVQTRKGPQRSCRIVKGLDAVWAHFCLSKPCLEPVSSMVFSVAALKTQISWAEWIGFALILCTVFLSVSEKEDG